MSDRIFVESLDPAAAYPVAGVYRNFTDVGTAFVQQIIPTGLHTIVNTQIFVLPATAMTLLTANVTRHRGIIGNKGGVTIYVGASAVASGTGFGLDPGAALTLHTT